MIRLIVLIIAISMAAGCATPKYGNLMAAKNTPYGLNAKLVDDAVTKLEALYPPASTQFNIGQPILPNDNFGQELISTLRNHGYAVQEFSKKQPVDIQTGTSLRYIIDPYQELYRIKLLVGAYTLTRAYIEQDDSIVPAGSWARLEN
ncbi:hypothetical protein [Methylomonas sp. AM2-LC]|uniref:hypothetical protein n=1 Tax=Methylomonas sp. AM2-LC TaxID=3153301 RepID=UPI003264B705